MTIYGKKKSNVDVRVPTRAELKRIGLSTGVVLCVFVVNKTDTDEYLAFSEPMGSEYKRGWGSTPEAAQVYSNPKNALSAITGYDKGVIERCPLFEHKKQIFVWPMPDEAFE
ncbi:MULTISPECIES: hypothetical protein [unclassified Pseudoalteromonas]|uniref:hypothetical protein n=1 Tax=unclassified Pseudoalteromonas TaxID=194690 RepID=UPI001602EB6F|nr:MULTISPECIES: hypothetical protein [unclassified Pseudoalteromonas]MBB1295460.1 hypothetical protein [Pseudoalteromonas sp. SR41-4]MBB1410246.1 hypothetical protein [Pseudoalteromonas sp. SG44-17]MBB1470633.1 hypothetical protein [Pseudoalteromonas sp. SG41-5]